MSCFVNYDREPKATIKRKFEEIANQNIFADKINPFEFCHKLPKPNDDQQCNQRQQKLVQQQLNAEVQNNKQPTPNMLPLINLTEVAGEFATETSRIALGVAKDILSSFAPQNVENTTNHIGLNVFTEVKNGMENVCF